MTDVHNFMQRRLDSLPAETLVETNYNTRARGEAWHSAEVKTRYLKAKRDFGWAEKHYRHYFQVVNTDRPAEDIRALRYAIAEQILRPAPDKAAVR